MEETDETSTERLPTCPTCGSSLFENRSEFYCWECGLHVCPICLVVCGFVEDSEVVCDHYIGEYANGFGYADALERDPEGMFDFFSREDEMPEEMLEAIEKIPAEELVERFGPFAIFQSEKASLINSLEALCDNLSIPVERAYNDEQFYRDILFTSVGGDEAWRRMNAAMGHLKQGLDWLEEQAAKSDA